MLIGDSVKTYKHIIWDWNGTLLDDVSVVIDAMNNLLEKRNLPLLDIEKYKEIFTFPVIDYYARLGFDFSVEPFEKLAAEFISLFNSDNYRFRLHDGVEKVLDFINNMGMSQSILSASQEPGLIEDVGRLNITGYFVAIAGLNNHYANSKVERAKELLAELGLKPEEVLLIGDTVHDYEVSKEIGCDCLLVCSGHQSRRKILTCGTSIIESITDVIDFLSPEAIA